MAKRPRPRRAARNRPAEADDQLASCRLHPIPGSIDFGAPTGETVNLFIHDHVGVVLISKAEYGGKQLVPAGQAVSEIDVEVLPARNTLKMVFVFSASISGRGELRERCGDEDSQFVRAL
jgi:hypothetical protein